MQKAKGDSDYFSTSCWPFLSPESDAVFSAERKANGDTFAQHAIRKRVFAKNSLKYKEQRTCTSYG